VYSTGLAHDLALGPHNTDARFGARGVEPEGERVSGTRPVPFRNPQSVLEGAPKPRRRVAGPLRRSRTSPLHGQATTGAQTKQTRGASPSLSIPEPEDRHRCADGVPVPAAIATLVIELLGPDLLNPTVRTQVATQPLRQKRLLAKPVYAALSKRGPRRRDPSSPGIEPTEELRHSLPAQRGVREKCDASLRSLERCPSRVVGSAA
jgi:hypothetical protein